MAQVVRPGGSGGEFSQFLAKHQNRLGKAFDAAKTREIDTSNMGQVPAGIEAGVAQLVECKLIRIAQGKKYAGEWCFFARGVCKLPLEHNGIPTYGLSTSIIETLADTPESSGKRKTFDDHVGWMIEQLRMLAPDLDWENASFADLESIIAAIKDARPHFRFRTWKGPKATTGPYKNQEPRVMHTWLGYVDFEEAGVVDPSDPATGVEDNGVAEEIHSSNGQQAVSAGDNDDSDAPFDEFEDTPEPLEGALASEEPSSQHDTTEHDTDEQDTSEQAQGWEVGQVCSYRPIDKKTKKRSATSVECEIIGVSDDGGSYTLRNLTDSRVIYKGVKEEYLQEIE